MVEYTVLFYLAGIGTVLAWIGIVKVVTSHLDAVAEEYDRQVEQGVKEKMLARDQNKKLIIQAAFCSDPEAGVPLGKVNYARSEEGRDLILRELDPQGHKDLRLCLRRLCCMVELLRDDAVVCGVGEKKGYVERIFSHGGTIDFDICGDPIRISYPNGRASRIFREIRSWYHSEEQTNPYMDEKIRDFLKIYFSDKEATLLKKCRDALETCDL